VRAGRVGVAGLVREDSWALWSPWWRGRATCRVSEADELSRAGIAAGSTVAGGGGAHHEQPPARPSAQQLARFRTPGVPVRAARSRRRPWSAVLGVSGGRSGWGLVAVRRNPRMEGGGIWREWLRPAYCWAGLVLPGAGSRGGRVVGGLGW
jgi:hypothetical protein